MNIERLSIGITGTRPLLMAKPTALLNGNGNGKRAAGEDPATPEEIAEMSAYRSDNGALYIITMAFYRAFITAGKAFQNPNNKKTFLNGIIASGILPVTDEVTLVNPDTGDEIKTYEIDTRIAVNRNCRPPAAILTHRPKVFPWSCVLELEWDSEVIAVDLLLQVMERAGRYVGVLAFRPDTDKGHQPGPFGKFEVTIL